MIPAAFDYVAPETLDEALERLASEGDEAKIMAGGHSLLPLMKLRLANPTLVIDLGRIASLRYIRETDGFLDIGAMTRYHELQHSDVVKRGAPILAQASGLVGDAQVRHRGTIGGALAHADPAGDLPAVVTVLSAVIRAQSPRGTRDIPAAEFFAGIFESVIEPDEIVTSIRVPITSNGKQHYEKFRRRLCDWAIVGSAVALQMDGGQIRSARVALTNVGPTPMPATAVEQALQDSVADEDSFARAAENADEGLDPTPELNAPAEYKRHLARVITRRALVTAAAV